MLTEVLSLAAMLALFTSLRLADMLPYMLALSLADVLRDSLRLAESLKLSPADVLTDSLSLAESLKLAAILVEILAETLFRILSELAADASASLSLFDVDVSSLLFCPYASFPFS